MMRAMVEDGMDSLVARFAAHAATLEVSARVEGSPLLECVSDDLILHLFERTGPYVAPRGPARVIVQPETASLTRLEPGAEAPERRVEVVAVSVVHVQGIVTVRDDPFVVVDAGIPLVVSVDEVPDDVREGDAVRFKSRAPLHGFVLPPERKVPELAPDDQV